eukprot:UN07708
MIPEDGVLIIIINSNPYPINTLLTLNILMYSKIPTPRSPLLIPDMYPIVPTISLLQRIIILINLLHKIIINLINLLHKIIISINLRHLYKHNKTIFLHLQLIKTFHINLIRLMKTLHINLIQLIKTLFHKAILIKTGIVFRNR